MTQWHASAHWRAAGRHRGRGLHSFTLELNLGTLGTRSWVKLGYVGTKSAQFELKCEQRV